jgi:hypothetical protein
MYSVNPATFVLGILSVATVSAVSRAEDAKDQEKVLRHAVFFKFKDDTSAKDVGKVVAAFDGLPKKIDSIANYQRGKNFSPVGLDDGFTHCFLITFKDEAGRAKYLPHPDHKAFGAMLRPHLDKVFVIDYWGKREKASADRRVKHALFLKFKEGASPQEVKSIEDAISRLAAQCDSVKAFEWGKNNSPEKHDEGFTHCFMFTFDNVDGLKKYATMPAHQAVVAKIMTVAEQGRVLDFWTKDKAASENQ